MQFMRMIVIAWLLFCSGCAKPPAIYVDQLNPIPLKKDVPFTPPQDGWFLTDPALAQLLEATD